MFAGKVERTRGKHFSGVQVFSKLLALLTNISLGWKRVPVANTLAYYGDLSIMVVKSFVTLGPGCFEEPD